MMHWTADTIDITEICERASWHRATSIASVIEAGFSPSDAAGFVDFVFNERALESGGRTDGPSEDLVSDAQYERLALARG